MKAEAQARFPTPLADGPTDWKIYRRLVKYVRPHWHWFAVAVIGFLAGGGAEAYFAQLLGTIIDALDEPTLRHSWLFPALMLAAATTRAVGTVTGEFFLSRISFRVVQVIRNELFERLLVLPSAFFDRSARGHLVSRITFNTAQLRDTATDALKSIVQDGGKVLVIVTWMLYQNWLLTVIFVAVAPIVGGIVRLASKRFRRISGRIQSSMGDVTHAASETVSGYQVMRTFGGEPNERRRFFSASETNRKQNLKMVTTKAASTQIIQLLVAIALALLVGLVFQPDIRGEMSKGDLVAYIGLAALLANPIKKLSEVNARLQRGLAAAVDVFSQLDQPPELDEGTFEAASVRGRVEFRGVTFCYESGVEPVLHNVSFVAEPGQTVALVGRSGGGKSTIANLIPRFYEPQSGEILLDDRPVSDYRLANLRAQLAYVPQDVWLFNDSLRNNVAYGALSNADERRVHEAIVRAHADEFANDLPEGLDTVVGDNGVLLSGGQRQRVAIARAFLKDAPVLLLDEATSALDSESELHIQAALEQIMRGRTTLVIAHRLSTIERADKIVVIENGRVVEEGTHATLLAANGHYTALYRSQFTNGADSSIDDLGIARAGDSRGPAVPAPPLTSPVVDPGYDRVFWPRLGRPLASIYRVAANRRRRFQERRAWRAPVPVVVVGNISVGGTGKTPLVIWLAQWLSERGVRVGIVSRGYGGRGPFPLLIDQGAATGAADATALAGDEAPMIARRTGCPVVVDPDRVRAVKHLLANADCDVIVSDDGLQHYALARDVEIVVLDAMRGLGNGLMLPAGPLREPVERLDQVDWVVVNGAASNIAPKAAVMSATPRAVVVLATGERCSPETFSDLVDGPLFAVCGVGNPHRFQATLHSMNLDAIIRSYPDHHEFTTADLDVPAGAWVIVTEKDAGKIKGLPGLPERLYYLEIDMSFHTGVDTKLTDLFSRNGIGLRRPAVPKQGGTS